MANTSETDQFSTSQETLETESPSVTLPSVPQLIPGPDELPAQHQSGFVSIIGSPNVGKSTLINTFIGLKIAIVSNTVQTTRNRLLGILTEDDYQIVFVDTPGIHDPIDRLGEYMVMVATRTIADSDVVVWMISANEPVSSEDRLVAEALSKRKNTPPIIFVMNKVDLIDADQIKSRLKNYLSIFQIEPKTALPLSLLTGFNRDVLLEKIIELLPVGPRYFPQNEVTDQKVRFIVAELVREATFDVLYKEIPHSVVVEVEEFKSRSETLTYVEAHIFVERESQKGIIIGKGGQTIKRIGKKARLQIEDLVGTKVYLQLRIKVQPNWRKKPTDLRRFGYWTRDNSESQKGSK
ncbi:MAG: GTPase Era [Anaerolineaceae bacterium 4572_78]|nr:MAG: GTPase Era [Anaerolineaceae bacterium 4572_78]